VAPFRVRSQGRWNQSSNRWREDRRAILEFNRSLSLIVDADALMASIAARIKELFGADRILLLRSFSDNSIFTVAFSSGYEAAEHKKVQLTQNDRLAKWLQTNERVLALDQDEEVFQYLSAPESQMLQGLDVRVCAPLVALNRLNGIMLLSSTRPHWCLGKEDLTLLQMLTSLASIAFENAYLYQEQRDRLRRLYRTERLATAGELAASVAHEIRNPLTSIRSTVQYLWSSYPEGDPKRSLTQGLLAEVDRINQTLEGLLNLTRRTVLTFERLSLTKLLEESLLLVRTKAHSQSVNIVYDSISSNVYVRGDALHLKQVLLNIMLNALQAMEHGGTLEVKATLKPPAGSKNERYWAQVAILDTGCGIPADRLEKIFDPFFTTRHGGTGLGLTISYNITKQHGGELEVYSEEEKGTRVELRLPAASEFTEWNLTRSNSDC
jgi:signal transduction histidine kinase